MQYRIVDEHGFVLARADLAYSEAKLAIEYDGRTHLDPIQTERDRQRDAELAAHGWQTCAWAVARRHRFLPGRGRARAGKGVTTRRRVGAAPRTG